MSVSVTRFGLIGLLLCASAWARWDKGDTAEVRIKDLRFTQFVVGEKEVEFRVETIEEEEQAGTLDDYLWERRGEAVIGPGQTLFLIDGHHLLRALRESGRKWFWVDVVKNYEDLSWKAFWAKMKGGARGKKPMVYLRDGKNRPKSVSKLPRDILDLEDDPYRSLAWMVRKSGGYDDIDEPFQEFQWARFFRRHIRFDPDDSEGWARALRQAMRMAASRKTEDLHGWHGERGDCSAMLEWLGEHEE